MCFQYFSSKVSILLSFHLWRHIARDFQLTYIYPTVLCVVLKIRTRSTWHTWIDSHVVNIFVELFKYYLPLCGLRLVAGHNSWLYLAAAGAWPRAGRAPPRPPSSPPSGSTLPPSWSPVTSSCVVTAAVHSKETPYCCCKVINCHGQVLVENIRSCC